MTALERANLVLAFAKSLYASGQATEQMVDAAKRLGRALGLRATIIPLRRVDMPETLGRSAPPIPEMAARCPSLA